MTTTRAARVAVLALLLGAVTGCGDPGSSEGRSLHVYAASSLTAAFEQLATDFEADHPGVAVDLSFGGSADLVAQIDQGAPADVLASADEPTMAELVSADLVAADPAPFATNTLEIAVPPDNPAHVRTMADLAAPGVQLVTCAPQVPCGAATEALADRVGVSLRPVSEEQSVTDVLNKVASGEADAGLVYVTDVEAAGGDVTGIEVPEAADVVNVYPIAPVAGSDEAELAREFVNLVLSDRGRKVLTGLGFGAPPGER